MAEKYYLRPSIIYIGSLMSNIDIQGFIGEVLIEEDYLYLSKNESGSKISLNGVQIDDGAKVKISIGSELIIDEVSIIFYEAVIKMILTGNIFRCDLMEQDVKKYPFEKYPLYKRSPRIIKPVDESTIEILMPPKKNVLGKSSIIQIIVPPILMVIVTVIISIFLKRGIYVFMSVATTFLTTLFSVVKYFSDINECKRKNIVREQNYNNYLLSIRKKIYDARRIEALSYAYNHPENTEIGSILMNFQHRIYEKSLFDEDFLSIVVGREIGIGKTKIAIKNEDIFSEKDELELSGCALKSEYENIENIPVVIDLKKAHLGLIGDQKVIHEQLKVLLLQVVAFHSYHDVEIICIHKEQNASEFEWLKWLQHNRIHALNISGNISSGDVADQILGSLHHILKERNLLNEEKENKEIKHCPHLLFVIDYPQYVIEHIIMEYLEMRELKLGFSMIYCTYSKENLPENIGTIVQYFDSQKGKLLLNEKNVENRQIELDKDECINYEVLARNLGGIVHEPGVSLKLPESITFFEMYGIKNPEELRVHERWSKNQSYKSLAVPLGVRVTGDLLYLNLHEKAHGPHGLVAGTTGSGKSEIVQSYILSLAVNFHPHEVGFLLIDYKGGGMANLFDKLPHLLGTITNLDGSESMRALASIRSELARRQRIFMQQGVNHINAYNILFKENKVDEPIPHLFIISDEFAELKKEQPEFMAELVSTARVGRSLGIHLILATQKPSGVVTDQIWTNSKFKLALKVQSESDSKEVIKSPDAAFITQPGRAYLQVGNNEIYELFQSAFSGADYFDDDEIETVDNRVYLMNVLGQAELINEDLSNVRDRKNSITQLDAIVNYIDKNYKQLDCIEVRRPWLPPLEEKLVTSQVLTTMPAKLDTIIQTDTLVQLGCVDIPEEQRQVEYMHDFSKEGSIAIFGASGFGKTSMITTILVSLAIKNNPQLLRYYILDMGNSGLLSLKKLPHVAEYFSFEDVIKLKKFYNVLGDIIKKRKKLFAEAGVVNIEMYNSVTSDKLPMIIFTIDNYDVHKEMDQDLESFITQVARDGFGLGIYVILAASRPSVLRFAIANCFKRKMSFLLYDTSEYSSVVGKGSFLIPEIRGRSIVKLDKACYMQTYIVVEYESEIDYLNNVRELVLKISQNYDGERILGIPMLPERLTNDLLKDSYFEDYSDYEIPIGLEVDTVKCEVIDLRKSKQLIVGTSQSGRTNLLKILIANRSKNVETYLVDDSSAELMNVRNEQNLHYYDVKTEVCKFLSDIKEIVEERNNSYYERRANDSSLVSKDYFASLPVVMLVISEWEEFIAAAEKVKELNVELILVEANKVNVSILVSANSSRFKGYDSLSKYMRDTLYGVVTGDVNNQSVFSFNKRIPSDMTLGVGYIISKGEVVKIQIAQN